MLVTCVGAQSAVGGRARLVIGDHYVRVINDGHEVRY
jgi:hypothetical protein